MDQKQDYKEKYERAKLHTRYLFIIAGILAVIGISIALGGCSEALGQISMASTVSSIILSSIAIFMSISGENKLNYTHDKLVETSDRMSDITDSIEKANNLLDGTINQKLLRIDDMFDRLERIGQSVDNVEKEVLKRTFREYIDNTVNISNDILWQIYNEMSKPYNDNIGIVVERAMEYLIVLCGEDAEFITENFEKYLRKVVDADLFYIGYAVGVLHAFAAMGIFKQENFEFFKERMMLSEEKWNKIKKFL